MKCPVHGVYFMLPDGSRHCYLGCDWRGQSPPSFATGVEDPFAIEVDPSRFEDDSEEELAKIRKLEGPADPRAVLRLPPSDWLKDAWRLALNTEVFPIEPAELAWRQAKNKRRNRARFRARELRRLSGSSEPAPAVLPALAPVAVVKASRPDQPIGAVPQRPAGEPGPEADILAATRDIARGS